MDDDRNGVLLVRVWTEGGSGQFRARLTSRGTGGTAREEGELTVAVASSPEAVSRAVRSWLGAFLRGH